jgi:hypothetical protein
MTTMADLGDGVRIRHIKWDMTGTVRILGRVSEIRWDNAFGDMEISNEGVVFPRDVVVIGRAA